MKTLNQDHGSITLEDNHGREITIEDTDQGLNIVVGFVERRDPRECDDVYHTCAHVLIKTNNKVEIKLAGLQW